MYKKKFNTFLFVYDRNATKQEGHLYQTSPYPITLIRKNHKYGTKRWDSKIITLKRHGPETVNFRLCLHLVVRFAS